MRDHLIVVVNFIGAPDQVGMAVLEVGVVADCDYLVHHPACAVAGQVDRLHP